MTESEFNKTKFRYIRHVPNRFEHRSEYASKDMRLGLVVSIPYRNGQPNKKEKIQVYYRIDNKTYMSKEDFLIALEYFNP